MTSSRAVSAADLINAILPIADDHLVLGHRVSEWTGHSPMLEEDLSLPNLALDLLGQATTLYEYIAKLENQGRSEDDFAFLRNEREYKNLLLVERPNGNFGTTILRQFFFSAYMNLFWERAQNSSDELLKGVAGKAMKETSYHLRYCSEWVIRLGDGTEESANYMREAVEELYPYTSELFETWPALERCIEENILPDPADLRKGWDNMVERVFAEAFLSVPDIGFMKTGGRSGIHAECFGHLLSDLQYLQRTYPGLQW